MKKKIFAGLSHAQFMRRHWQKKPMLARAALAPYSDAITREDLMALACREDVESRLVTRRGGKWRVENGPFTRRGLAKLPESGWTLLVQGVDQELWQAAGLVREFAFIPFARFDDVMVSYAAPGGGVGPHFDSYDVFLVQGRGARRWQISRQRDLELVRGAPLKILRRFRAERECVLGPGDALYLPPRYAHNGVAIDECITYSIGFRAPTAQELGSAFLAFLEERLALPGMYSDPDLPSTQTPARIPAVMIERMRAMLEQIRWSEREIGEFAGRFLTEPKARVVFERPARPVPRSRFAQRLAAVGVRLALRTRMLTRGSNAFINGEMESCGAATVRVLEDLANERILAPPLEIDRAACDLLYSWYRSGYVELGANP